MNINSINQFNKVVLFTDSDGRAKFRDEYIDLTRGSPESLLSEVLECSGYQLRTSPIGFQSQFHCTTNPQWCFILSGAMEIGIHDGVSRIFSPGEHFYSADLLPEGHTFDPNLHGHCSRQVGDTLLITLFVRG